jgi:glycerol-3-phosphate dehydrogenase (NAD(P)+)
MANKKVTVIGAGAWGTALACAFARGNNDVKIWAMEEDVVKSINELGQNTIFFKGITLPKEIKATNNLEIALDADIIVLVPPAQFMRTTCENISKILEDKNIPLVICSKGVEQHSLLLMSEVVQEILPDNPIAILSGPSFADEVGKNLATAVTCACEDEALAKSLASDLSSDNFRIYSATDIIGAQIGNAVKNVIAIACGIAKGRGMGNNATAAIITRGLAEMRRLGKTKGAETETMMGLAGAGDIILTCSSDQSRNYSLGFALGEGTKLDDILNERGSVVTEGVHSAQSVNELAKSLDIEMPICQAVYGILYLKEDVLDTANKLMNRPLKKED